jgi:hypothetical protein
MFQGKLEGNPHFPVDEVELNVGPHGMSNSTSGYWPGFSGTEHYLALWDKEGAEDGDADAGGGGDAGDAAQPTPVSPRDFWALTGYLDLAPRHTQNARVLSLEFGAESPEWNLLLKSPRCPLAEVFAEGRPTHTLEVCENASEEFVCAAIKLNCPSLSCVILGGEGWELTEDLVAAVQGNPYLEQVPFDKLVVTGKAATMLSQCTHVSFEPKPDPMEPAPKVAARLAVPLANLQPAISRADFDRGDAALFGLASPLGPVVALAPEVIPRFRLVAKLLQEQQVDDAKKNYITLLRERVLMVDIEPPLRDTTLALAVHFVTHYVPEAVHKVCEEMEDKGPAGPVAVDVDVDEEEEEEDGDEGEEEGEDEPSVSDLNLNITWCAEFDRFLEVHIATKCTGNRQLHVLCELMAVAAYLDVPALKRFVRGALAFLREEFRKEEEEDEEDDAQ